MRTSEAWVRADRVPSRRNLPSRTRSIALIVAAIALGLAVHLRGDALLPSVRDVLGDALWAAMVTWGIAAVAPSVRLPWRAVAALVLCYVVECSQLIHTPALDAARRTTAGQLVLGSGFDPRDFAAYAAGVLVAALVEWVGERRGSRRDKTPFSS